MYPGYLISNTRDNDETLHHFAVKESNEEGEGGDSAEEFSDLHSAARDEVLIE
jgi:hypothetical protein